MKEGKVHALALSLVPGIGPIHYKSLTADFGTAEKVFSASVAELAEVPGVGAKLAKSIKESKGLELAEKSLTRCQNQGVDFITLEEPEYPANLRNIVAPPPFLYLKGQLNKEDDRAVAIVGTRRCSNYGRLAAEKLSRQLASLGITVISGMAKGVDSISHRAALSLGGRTIGVLGCGLDIIYPGENRDLYNKIPAKGALISEFPFGEPPRAHNFPRRNRIISGLSLGVVVVEAPARSGALITAALALDQGREVFAVPGSPELVTSQGCNRLIKMGAKLTEDVEDILSEILPQLSQTTTRPELPKPDLLSADEQKILQVLFQAPTHVDAIVEQTGFSPAKALGLLTTMELSGGVRQLPGKVFVKGF